MCLKATPGAASDADTCSSDGSWGAPCLERLPGQTPSQTFSGRSVCYWNCFPKESSGPKKIVFEKEGEPKYKS